MSQEPTPDVDRWLADARVTWKRAAERDDARVRTIAIAPKPQRRAPIVYGFAIACAVLIGIALRRPAEAPLEIHADPSAAPSVAVEPAVEVIPAAPLPLPVVQPSALPELPPLPSPPEPPPSETKRDRSELRAASREIERGQVKRARTRLHALLRRGDPAVIYEAARMLADTYDHEPGREVEVWNDSLEVVDSGPYRALIERERAHALDAGLLEPEVPAHHHR